MRKVLIAVAAFVVVAAGAALPSGAGTTNYMVTIAPTSGVTGTVVTFTPQNLCPSNSGAANGAGDYDAAVSRTPDPSTPADFVADTVTDPSGDWSLNYAIPGTEPLGDITFYAFCLYEPFPVVPGGADAGVPVDFQIVVSYDPVVFTVTAPPTTTTTSTSTTSTSTTSTTAKPVPQLVATPTSVFPGDTIAVNASGFKPGSNVVITLESDPVNLGSFVADSAGRIAANVVVPANFPAGSHTLKLTGTDIAGAVLVLSTGITVGSRVQAPTTAAAVATTVATATTTSTLPKTGSSFTLPALVVSAALVLLGATAVLASRRRRSSPR